MKVFKLLQQFSWAVMMMWAIKHKVCISSFQVSRGHIMWQVTKSWNIYIYINYPIHSVSSEKTTILHIFLLLLSLLFFVNIAKWTVPLGLHGLLQDEQYLFFLLFINYYYYSYLLIHFICGKKQLVHEADHLLQSSSESTNEFKCTSNPTYDFMVCTGITLCLPLTVALTF